jgi:ribosome-associated protein
MLVVSGLSAPHLKALFNEVQSEFKKQNTACYRRSGDADGGWMVLDYVDVVIHIFLPETREFYGLEELWTARPEES